MLLLGGASPPPLQGQQVVTVSAVDIRPRCGCHPRHDGFTEAGVNGADRVRQLMLAGHLLHDGRIVEPGWVAAQLWDLADLITAGMCPR